MNVLKVAMSVTAASVLAGTVQAKTIDLITAGAANDSGTANGTIYSRIDPQSTGTGVFTPFLRIHNKGTEDGYNADYKNQPDVPAGHETVTGTWTHSLQFDQLIYTEITGVGYYEFLLDLDEPNSDSFEISLDSVQIFTSTNALSSPYSNDLSTLGTKRYDMDVGADGDVTVNLDGQLTHGNGQADMVMYVLASLFEGTDAKDYVTFYSAFGVPLTTEGSFEEWGLRDCPTCKPPGEVPVPGTLGLLGIGLAGLGLVRRRKS